jgi:hypothetical protein
MERPPQPAHFPSLNATRPALIFADSPAPPHIAPAVCLV